MNVFCPKGLEILRIEEEGRVRRMSYDLGSKKREAK